MGSVWASESQLQRFRDRVEMPGKITMLNLLRFREIANYTAADEAAPCSGITAYERYAALVFPLIKKLGGRIIVSGAALGTVVGPQDEEWDRMIIVEYPSIRVMLGMMSSQEYLSIAHHRTAALADSRLIPVTANERAKN
ncbi:MAG: DUF1330 domain-containing protein [Pseudomonadota bacterium]